MHCTGQVEDGTLRGELGRWNQIVTFQCTFLAKTHGTDVPTPITLDALGKLREPTIKALFQLKGLELNNGLKRATLGPFPFHILLRVWTKALTGLGQVLGADDAHRDHFVLAAHQDPEGLLRVGAGKMQQLFIEGIAAVPWFGVVSQHQTVQIIRVAEQTRTHMAILPPQAQKALYLA
jgi:hypothetical protein